MMPPFHTVECIPHDEGGWTCIHTCPRKNWRPEKLWGKHCRGPGCDDYNQSIPSCGCTCYACKPPTLGSNTISPQALAVLKYVHQAGLVVGRQEGMDLARELDQIMTRTEARFYQEGRKAGLEEGAKIADLFADTDGMDVAAAIRARAKGDG